MRLLLPVSPCLAGTGTGGAETLDPMRRIVIVVVALAGLVGAAAGAAPNPAGTAFTRGANSPAGRALLETSAPAVTAGSETWAYTGQDILPFNYEQGAAYAGDALIFSSRGELIRTAIGCPDALDPYGPCYDVLEQRLPAIEGAEFQQGFNHIGGIDVGRAGPAEGHVFAPLETDTPRTRRGFQAYDVGTFATAGKLIEVINHRFHSWVAVEPTGNYLIAAEDRMDPIRVYAIARAGSQVTFTRRADLDVTGVASPAPLPNMQGCKFDPRDASGRTIYCADWRKKPTGFNLDEATQIFRLVLSAPIGTPGATASASLAFRFTAAPRYAPVTSNTPYGLETEDLAFYERDGRMELHVALRGETLGWFHWMHFDQRP